MRTRIVPAAAIAAAVLALSCSEGSRAPVTSTDPGPGIAVAALRSIALTPTTASIMAGESLQFTATPAPSGVTPSAYAWTSSSPAVATVSPSGLVTAIAAGSAMISASASGVSGESAIIVTMPPPPAPPPTPTPPAPTPPANDVVLVGAGDIASCLVEGDEATARLLDAIPGIVFNLGDNAYDNGSATEFTKCYGPSWGRHFERTRPSPGNHEYGTANATGYFTYFGRVAGDPTKGYYSYDAGGGTPSC